MMMMLFSAYVAQFPGSFVRVVTKCLVARVQVLHSVEGSTMTRIEVTLLRTTVRMPWLRQAGAMVEAGR